MLRVLGCLTTDHDHGLLVAAALICILSVVAALSLIGGKDSATRNAAWRTRRLLPGAVALGAGVWATHFVAMLAYDPGLPVTFDPSLTLLSALVAVLGALASLHLWLEAATPARRGFAGLVLGLGIGVMHYGGMAAIRLPGHLVYAPDLLVASILLGSLILSAAMALVPAAGGPRRRPALVLALVAGVAVLHATGMGAVTVFPDPTVVVDRSFIDRNVLAMIIASAAGIVLFGILAVLMIEARLTLSAQQSEGLRLRSIADASFEGLVLCAMDGRITEVNSRVTALSGFAREALIGRYLPDILDMPPAASAEDIPPADAAQEPQRATLRAATGNLPVELIRADLDTAEGRRQVVAIRDLRDRLRAEARIVYLAHHDPLTGLANRTVLHERLAEACREGRRSGIKLAVLCIDLDRFKPINDMFGHAAGDLVLRETARRLLTSVRSTDTVARVGGDEFVIVQRHVHRLADAEVLARKLLAALELPIEIEGHAVRIAGSIGIAVFPGDSTEPDELLSKADLALYRVKQSGRGDFAFFHPDMDADAQRRRELERDLTLALERDEFALLWQPQVGVSDSTIVGFEALLRWRHPQRGPVPPDSFIPIAEATGVIIPLGEWVLRRACVEAASWTTPLRVAVNVSPAQIQQDGFVAMLQAVLRESGLAPARLELEVTEGMFIRDPLRALATLTQVKQLGVQVAIDDFGTGFSSLSTLRSFPFDRIKIDRSFVKDMDTNLASAAIVRAVVGLAHGLGLPVVAEGVETQAQFDALSVDVCTEVQGFLFSKPASIGTFAALLHPAPTAAQRAA